MVGWSMTDLQIRLQQIAPDNATRALLKANGISDRVRGMSMSDGWTDLCNELDWDPHMRTTAKEAYEDGYFQPEKDVKTEP
jgi:hypothetical protein